MRQDRKGSGVRASAQPFCPSTAAGWLRGLGETFASFALNLFLSVAVPRWRTFFRVVRSAPESTYTDKSPLFRPVFRHGIWLLVQESPAAQSFSARMRALEKRVALLWALLPGIRHVAVLSVSAIATISSRTRSGCSIGRKWLAPSTLTVRAPARLKTATSLSRQVLAIVP